MKQLGVILVAIGIAVFITLFLLTQGSIVGMGPPTSFATVSEKPSDKVLNELSKLSGSTPFPEGTITETHTPDNRQFKTIDIKIIEYLDSRGNIVRPKSASIKYNPKRNNLNQIEAGQCIFNQKDKKYKVTFITDTLWVCEDFKLWGKLGDYFEIQIVGVSPEFDYGEFPTFYNK